MQINECKTHKYYLPIHVTWKAVLLKLKECLVLTTANERPTAVARQNQTIKVIGGELSGSNCQAYMTTNK